MKIDSKHWHWLSASLPPLFHWVVAIQCEEFSSTQGLGQSSPIISCQWLLEERAYNPILDNEMRENVYRRLIEIQGTNFYFWLDKRKKHAHDLHFWYEGIYLWMKPTLLLEKKKYKKNLLTPPPQKPALSLVFYLDEVCFFFLFSLKFYLQ